MWNFYLQKYKQNTQVEAPPLPERPRPPSKHIYFLCETFIIRSMNKTPKLRSAPPAPETEASVNCCTHCYGNYGVDLFDHFKLKFNIWFQDLKKSIIDDGLSTIVNLIIIPHSGWDPTSSGETCWSTVFRNTSGVLRYTLKYWVY